MLRSLCPQKSAWPRVVAQDIILVDVCNHTSTDRVPGLEVEWVPTLIGVKGREWVGGGGLCA